jgi:DNA modification methylase
MNPDVRLIHGDCLAVLPELDPTLIGAVVTDPPYGISHSSNYGASWQGTEIANDESLFHRDMIVRWAEEHGKPWAVFGTWKRPRPPETRAVLVWDKGPAFGMGDLSFPWKGSWEEIYIGGPGWHGRRDEGVLRGYLLVSWETKGRVHPHQKPVSLLTHILSKLPRDLVILDPFAGSGSTLVACRKSGRAGIGIEINEGYCEVIRKRLKEAETPLFAAIDAIGEGRR